jgi:homogentisate 1,2-dioxygenase
MFFYKQGEHTRQAHKGIPEGHFEEEQGRRGFYGPVSHLIRKKPSTRWKTIEGPLKPRMFDLVETKHEEKLQRLFFNADVTLYNLWMQPKKGEKLKSMRNADGDFIYFVHLGSGVVITEYGLLKYRPGDYVMIPKCVPHTILPEKESQFFVIENLGGDFREPDRGIAGRNAVYDTAQINPPDLEAQQEFLKKNHMACTVVEAKHSGETTKFTYDDCIYADIIGWKGDFFPFTLNMDQIMPLMSHRAHLPPSAHTTFVAQNFVVCSFVPRPLESDADALRVPFYHQNIDYDEILFYHNGDFFSRQNLHAGMLSFHPAGFPHGPHPKAIEKVKGKTHTDEYAVMIDTRRPLERDKSIDALEVESYWKSWQG